MQVWNRLFTSLLVLLCSRAGIAEEETLSDNDCERYHELRSPDDYEQLVEDCAGKRKLNFGEGVASNFYAKYLREEDFNKLFANAAEVGFNILVENAPFENLRMPKLERFIGNGGLSIRNNLKLRTFKINRAATMSRDEIGYKGPMTVTVDGNPMLDQDSVEVLRRFCSFCDVFPYTKCSALGTIQDYNELVRQCAGERIIKQKPGERVFLNANKLTQEQFNALFSQATHVELCIIFRNMEWEDITFPKLLRLINCGGGDSALEVVHNYHLKSISLPVIDSEGFGRKNSRRHIVFKNNFILPKSYITTMSRYCDFCRLSPYKECDDIDANARWARNITIFIDRCGGKRIIKPRQNQILFLDISSLSQELVNELFSDVTTMNVCIIMKGSQIQYLRMPHLKELHSCKEGMPAFLIENNAQLRGIELAPNFNFNVKDYLFVIVDNRNLMGYDRFNSCKNCVIERQTRCGRDRGGYETLEELFMNCRGKRKIVFKYDVVLNENQFNLLCSNALQMKMCFKIVNTNYQQISCPHLRYVEPCQPGKQVFTIIGNPYLAIINIPDYLYFPPTEKIFIVKKNQRVTLVTITKLKKICPQCEIEGYFSKCSGMGPITDVATFLRMCAGQPFIDPRPGVVLEVDLSKLNEMQLMQLFANVVEMKICITIRGSSIRKLSFPKLTKWTPCAPGKAALTLVFNYYLQYLEFPVCKPGCVNGALIQNNPRLPQSIITLIAQWCNQCMIEYYVPSCGLGSGPHSMIEYVHACAGKPIIMGEGSMIIIDASKISEAQMNAFCSRAVYMEACIVISQTDFKSLKCPYLREVKPCQPGRAVFTIIRNPFLKLVDFPQGLVYPQGEKILIVKQNYRLSVEIIRKLKQICSYCEIEAFISKCSDLGPITNLAQFLIMCARQPLIEPRPGVVLEVDLSGLTDEQLQMLFENVVEMKICITIKGSSVSKLLFPKLIRWTSCAPGKPALTLLYNYNLEVLSFPACQLGCVSGAVIRYNPKLPRSILEIIMQWCTQCQVEIYVPSCGLGTGGFTAVDFVRACAGHSYIKPEGAVVIINSKEISEIEMNAFCSKAVYMEVCIVISNSNFRSLRCPYLKQVRPCKPGMAVFTFVQNPYLSVIEIPPGLIYPQAEKIIYVKRNQRLTVVVIEKLKKICPHCEIEGFFSKCGELGPITDIGRFLNLCIGQPIIAPRPGVILEVDLSVLTEVQLNQFFKNIVEMQICITIKGSAAKRLSFPKLTRWTPCAPGKAALTLMYNFELTMVEFPSCKKGCINGALIQYNPKLPKYVIDMILKYCTYSTVEYYVPSCGLGNGGYSMIEFVRACAGKPIIIPEGVVIVIDSNKVTENEMNAFCSKAVFMQVCIVISESSYKSLRCPYLREVRPCQAGKPVFTILNNMELSIIKIPVTIVFPINTIVFEIEGNPLIPREWLLQMKKKCPRCRIVEATACGLNSMDYTDKQLALACAGKSIIRPAKGFYLTINSQYVTEIEMNNMCSKAVYMEICITISNSMYKALRCPYLKQLKPCLPGHPAITIVDNPFFQTIQFPLTVVYPKGVLIIEIRGNPMLDPSILGKLKPWCRDCVISFDYACGITSPTFTVKELVTACAGKKYIKPASGVVLVVKSSDVTEVEMNLLCSRAVYMEICIEITNSLFTSLRCPHLRELRPCRQGRPAILIVNNRRFSHLVIPPRVIYPPGALIVEIRKNPMLDPSILFPLKEWCKNCMITLEYACGIGKINFTPQELVVACTGHEYIRPPPGVVIVITSETVTEAQLNRMCEKAVYMEVCIEIKRSTFTALRCPHLRELKPCQPGRPAILLEYNPFFEIIEIPTIVKYPPGEQIISIKRMPGITAVIIRSLQQWCPHCNIDVDYLCGMSTPKFTALQVIGACSGKQYIVPAKNIVVVVKSKDVEEHLMNNLCSRAIVMKICIEITQSAYKGLRCPHLKELRPCKIGRPAIKIVNNPQFVVLQIPVNVVYPTGVQIIHIQRNPRFDPRTLSQLQAWCPHCLISGDYACGLNKPNPTAKELMIACRRKTVIVPMPGSMIIIHSNDFTEKEFTEFCSKVTYMEACITIEKTAFTSIQCPYLRTLKPCKPGMKALTIVENFNLKIIVIPPTLNIIEGVLLFEIRDNPRLSMEILIKLRKLCPGCTISFDADCGLTRPFTQKELIAACARKVIIRPTPGFIIEFNSSEMTEQEMTLICSAVAYMEACITIAESSYKSFRCPHLRELRPCARGRVAITVIDNPYLVSFFIPISVAYPKGAIILELAGNPLLPWEVVDNLRQHCKRACRFPRRNTCILEARDYMHKELVSTCAGKSVIKPLKGYVLIVSSKYVSEREMNALCASAVTMQICIVISESRFKSLRCPHLKELRPCKPGQPAITIVNNLYFTTLTIPRMIVFPPGALIFEVAGNPHLSSEIVKLLLTICPNCRITASHDCGLVRPFTIQQLAAACSGKLVIKPAPGYIIEIFSKDLSEAEMNNLCSKAVYMEVCITISGSRYESFRCPNLKELRPCAPGRAAITIINNVYLRVFEIPVTVIIPTDVVIFEISGNPLLPPAVLEKYKRICKLCRFLPAGACMLESRSYTDKQIVSICAGKTIIRPPRGYVLRISSQHVTEEEMNALCSKATHMEICITIIDSSYTSLRCPHLKELKPCKEGMPAIKIIRNFQFSILRIPSTVIVPQGAMIFEIAENPHLSIKIITLLRKICPHCRITANLACDLEGRSYSDKEIVKACAGKTIIKPAQGWILLLSSTKITETEMNALCSKVVYMEACLTITNSQFKALRCPHLRELRPCAPGRPAIKIVNNLYFEILEIPLTAIYPKNVKILEISEVPRMSVTLINRYKSWCGHCKITANLGCGLNKRTYSDAEMVAACAGKKIIKPAEGYMLVLSSDTVSETEMNAVCSKAIYMEICIVIRGSQYRSLRCPNLRQLKSCKPGVPAIRIIGNPMLGNVSISKALFYQVGTKTLEIRGNPKLSANSIATLKKLCPECVIRRHV